MPPSVDEVADLRDTSLWRSAQAAFTTLTGLPSRLLAFSDDMDGLRKVPDNVPNREMLKEDLGRPLTRIPDPFGPHEGFGAHHNA
ncbi:MAG: lysine--tRNA ligase, partial [Rhizobiales bacterium]|nr:lysine--tRNA ligase [Hyphomicrobiales bacterium]